MSNEQYKLHPISAVIHCVKGIKELIVPIVIAVFTKIASISSNDGDDDFWSGIIPILIVVIPSVLYLIAGITKWLTFRYWFEDGELRIKYGLFVKKKRFIPFERIQSFNHKEGIFHRIFGLVEVKIETAGGNGLTAEAELTAISKEAAQRIEDETKKGKAQTLQHSEETQVFEDAKAVEEESRIIHKMSTRDLVILATTSNSIGVVITGILAAYSQVSEYIPFDFIFDEVQSLMKYGFIFVSFIVFFAFLTAWILSVIITFLNYYDFTVAEQNDRLIITRGLIEKKRITIPLNRVQAIKILENPFRQLFKLTTVKVECVGGALEEKDSKTVLFPLISKKEIAEPLKNLFPHYDLELPLKRPSEKGRPFFYRKDLLWFIPASGLCSYFFYPYGLLSILAIIPLLLFRFWQYKTTAIGFSEKQLTIVFRSINRVTFVAQKKRIQVIQSYQSFFQKRRKVSSVEATVMSDILGSSAKAAHLDEEVADSVMNWFERKEREIESTI